MRVVNFVFLLLICYFVQSCGQITPAEEIRKEISNKNQQIIDEGFKVELNLFNCVSDDYLMSSQEELKHCLGYAFNYPVSILSAPLDTILSRSNYSLNFRYTTFLIEGKVIDIIVKRAHHVETGTSVGAEGKTSPIRDIIFEEMVFLQLETEGKTLTVLLDEKEIHDETIGSVEQRALDKYLRTDNINKKELYCEYSGNKKKCLKKGDTIFFVAVKSSHNWSYPQYSEGTNLYNLRDAEVDQLEKETKKDIFDFSFWNENKNNMAYTHFINPNKVFNSKEELLNAVRGKAEYSLGDIFMYLACD